MPTIGYTTHEALTQALRASRQPGDRCLLKASNAIGLDRVVQALS